MSNTATATIMRTSSERRAPKHKVTTSRPRKKAARASSPSSTQPSSSSISTPRLTPDPTSCDQASQSKRFLTSEESGRDFVEAMTAASDRFDEMEQMAQILGGPGGDDLQLYRMHAELMLREPGQHDGINHCEECVHRGPASHRGLALSELEMERLKASGWSVANRPHQKDVGAE
ncbi:uncharacterized protein K489DRAFT_402099 [Dissoconium aciculare CBS 342.82]|uniref:Uncharacterized protein n=1 Tax=Dissoconium aciculare CBS 342.82 TaxID=1314786 RepID=A0A6J3M2V2_9PEZI|nr:uncharacterized protein K489DRAFT_402099 [Dissoconium aciculare CBS 342.82]KAF1822356.1 hypothetical protein K489DRAFT_402099 [Dissoconium aciculare CBS 342.82]